MCFATRLKPQYLPVVQAELGTAPGRGRDLVGLVELFGGLGGARMAFERLGVDLAVYASSEIQPEAVRVTTARWPDCVHWGDVRSVDAAKVKALLAKAPHLKVVFVVGGSPCQGVSRINVGREGWSDERTQLARHIPRVAELIRTAAPGVKVHTLGENVASMTADDRDAFSVLYGSIPVELCSGGCSPVKRPRLYWISWPLEKSADLSYSAQGSVVIATLHGSHPEWAGRLERGAARPEGEIEPFATFVRPIPRSTPPLSPAGLKSSPPAALERWRQDEYRYPPYQYKVSNLVAQGALGCPRAPSGCRLRPLTSCERAVRLGFPWDHCQPAVKKGDCLKVRDAEDVRCGLLGNSFAVPVVAKLLGLALAFEGILPAAPSVEECWGSTGSAGQEYLQELAGEPVHCVAADKWHLLYVQSIIRAAIFKGSDVRLASGTLLNPAGWPRRGLEAPRWEWRVCCSFPFAYEDHINILELAALLVALKWRVRRAHRIACRFLHLCDSQVCIAVACKGRSSSQGLHRVLTRYCSLLLASSCHPFYTFVRSELNPADAPSRWW